MSSANATLMGRLTSDPELRYTQNGLPVVNFTIAHNPRSLDRSSNEWKDSGEPLFMRCTAWRAHAEHIAQLRKGQEVVALGRLQARTFQDREGHDRTVIEFEADVVAVDLRRQIATVAAIPASTAPADVDVDAWAPERAEGHQAAALRAV